MRLTKKITYDWLRLKAGTAGARFEARYRRRRATCSGASGLARVLYVLIGVLVMAAGVVMLVAPGPGWATFFLGLGLLGGEFLIIARFMDRLEVRLRAVWRGLRRMGRRAT